MAIPLKIQNSPRNRQVLNFTNTNIISELKVFVIA